MVLHHLGKFENKRILDKVQQMGNRLPAEILKTSVGDPNTLNLDPDPGLILREFVKKYRTPFASNLTCSFLSGSGSVFGIRIHKDSEY